MFVGHNFEHETRERLPVIGASFFLFSGFWIRADDGGYFERAGQVVNYSVEKRLDAFILESRSGDDRHKFHGPFRGAGPRESHQAKPAPPPGTSRLSRRRSRQAFRSSSRERRSLLPRIPPESRRLQDRRPCPPRCRELLSSRPDRQGLETDLPLRSESE